MPQLFRGLGMLGLVFYKSSPTIILLVLLVNFLCCDSTEKFKDYDRNDDVDDKIEIIQGQNDYLDKKNIRLEDFFWTGSGDGLNEPNTEPQNSATIYKTKTVLSTIYIESSSTHHNQTLPEQTTTCPINCDIETTPEDEINPTQTIRPDFNDTDFNTYDADRHYWLLTVLKGDGKDPVIVDLKNSLAKLYKTAFQRQQERHLGINGRTKREATEVDKPVDVYIHKVEKTPSDGEEKIEVLYHVAVSGQPVAATTAAADMHLVTDEEVTNELGYPFLIKAEPYLKANDPQYLTATNSTWVFIGVSLTIVFVLLLLVALLTLALSKRNKSDLDVKVKDSNPNIAMGISNEAFVSNETEKKQEGGKNRKSSTYVNFKSKTADRGIFLTRPQSSTSSSSFSVSSLDISPLMGLKKPPSPKKITVARPKAALNKTVPKHHRERKMSSDFDSDSSYSKKIRKNSVDVMDSGKDYQGGVVSPKSYLSMPSVKSFPRVNCIPEPLNKVLEPVSVLHLDITDDEYPEPSKDYESALTRHASLSTVEDPGVINPAVWNAHSRRLQNDETTASNNASKMRKRFHNLLDETFSLFGSQRDSSEGEKQTGGEIKSHSAATNRQTQDDQKHARIRPKTSDPRHSQPCGGEQPRGAWATNVATPLSRSLSAGSFRRPLTATTIDVERVLVDGSLSPNDIAVPLITAIKTELNKCSLPGSTNNLAE